MWSFRKRADDDEASQIAWCKCGDPDSEGVHSANQCSPVCACRVSIDGRGRHNKNGCSV